MIRARLLFFAAGLLSFFGVEMLYNDDRYGQTLLVSIVALLPGAAIAFWLGWKLGWLPRVAAHPDLRRAALWVGVALPYPYTLVLDTFLRRREWLPAIWEDAFDDPTSFDICTSIFLLLSLPWTAYALTRALSALTQRDEELSPGFRPVGLTMFFITSMLSLLPDAVWGIHFLHGVGEPLGPALFCAALGDRLSRALAAPATAGRSVFGSEI